MQSMQPRIKSPALTLPGALEAVRALSKATESCGVPRTTLELVHLRVGQLNGCSVCVDLHSRILKKLGESDARIWAVAAWREASYYTEAERAALTLAEAATRLDRADAVTDEVWNEVSRHFEEAELGALVMAIATSRKWRIELLRQDDVGRAVRGRSGEVLANGGNATAEPFSSPSPEVCLRRRATGVHA
jgi:AhpD family alkylhydroperoxidase